LGSLVISVAIRLGGLLSAVTGDVSGLVTVVTSTVTLRGLVLPVARRLSIGVGSAGALEGFMTEITTVETLNHLYLLVLN
jgi:hypothetical protein